VKRTKKDEVFVPEILPPSEDGVFKSLLTHPDAKPVLRDLIASILDIFVTDVEVRNTELPISDIREKRERFDVNCKIDGDKQTNVEMQSKAMKGDSTATGHENIKNRATHYLCNLHASQEGRSTEYKGLMQSRQITFCGYKLFPEKPDFISRYSLRDEAGEELSDAIGIAFIELPKLRVAMKKPVSKLTSAEMWGIFFGYADEPRCRELICEMIAAKEEIRMATELLTNISRDERERAHYLSRKMFLMDMEHDFAVTRKEGMEEGIKKGRKEGFTDGKAEVAKNALSMCLPIEQIEKLTGMSREEIEELRTAEDRT
jgi:predicted transposase/invertase (TIGR01784 family)